MERVQIAGKDTEKAKEATKPTSVNEPSDKKPGSVCVST